MVDVGESIEYNFGKLPLFIYFTRRDVASCVLHLPTFRVWDCLTFKGILFATTIRISMHLK
jgi:hypothetical protein